jgi:hypothetical protein
MVIGEDIEKVTFWGILYDPYQQFDITKVVLYMIGRISGGLCRKPYRCILYYTLVAIRKSICTLSPFGVNMTRKAE